MYVCVCNSISDKDIARLAAEGVTDAEEAYGRLGSEVNCGHCLEFAQMLLDEHSGGVSAVDLVEPEIMAASG